ncbi:vegetative incompatibility protein HET-E-1 [Naviculisporaceae sp. PSN 640]
MRLLNVDSQELDTFYDEGIPPYAILSHTWTRDRKHPEVLFEHMERPDRVHMLRYGKIEQTCRLAKSRGLDWVWIDTCCIDKSSSAELSEAINSMFRWYTNSSICFVHLEDMGDEGENLANCRWPGRGWTLQELLAPPAVEFYDKRWQHIGDRSALAQDIQSITGIPTIYLQEPRRDIRQARVGEKMSWAANRVTTRKEDTAYCLLGLFYVNMPLLYGEGDKAFLRLQEEIIKVSGDDSIFAWSPTNGILGLSHLWGKPIPSEESQPFSPFPKPLATSPRSFRCLQHKTLARVPAMKAATTWGMTKGHLQEALATV